VKRRGPETGPLGPPVPVGSPPAVGVAVPMDQIPGLVVIDAPRLPAPTSQQQAKLLKRGAVERVGFWPPGARQPSFLRFDEPGGGANLSKPRQTLPEELYSLLGLVEAQAFEQLPQGGWVARLEGAVQDRQPTGHEVFMIDLEQGQT